MLCQRPVLEMSFSPDHDVSLMSLGIDGFNKTFASPVACNEDELFRFRVKGQMLRQSSVFCSGVATGVRWVRAVPGGTC